MEYCYNSFYLLPRKEYAHGTKLPELHSAREPE